MADKSFSQQLGIGVSSLTFGVALSIFIFAVATGVVNGLVAWLLFATTFLLMIRFWWRYNELFVKNLPSDSFWHFLMDFAISFFGILAVLFVGNIQTWAAIGAAAMLASLIRCLLSWKDASNKLVKNELKKTIFGSVLMMIVFGAVFALSYFMVISSVILSSGVLILVFVFVISTSRKH